MDPDGPILHVSERLDPVEGWRAWRLVRLPGGSFGLGSLFSPEERWSARRALRATCAVEGSYHAAPSADCRCGYYAYAHRDRLASASRRSAVIGSVALWGSVVGHDFGYRAEFAYPQRLRLVCGRCLRIGRDRAPAWIVERRGEIAAVCSTHARLTRRADRTPAERIERELLGTYAVDPLPATGLTAPSFVHRFAHAVRSFFGAKTSIGWLLVALLVASVAFWGSSRTDDPGPPAAVAAVVGTGTSGVVGPDGGQSFRHPSAGIVVRTTCGTGPAASIEIVPCSKPHRWTSSAIFHAGIVPKCFGALVQTRPDGRRMCWVRAHAP